MKKQKHDLIIIGGGPGGYVAAIRAAQLGLNTACIEMESSFGGTCLRVGCIPSKALLESSHLFQLAQSGLSEHGIKTGKVQLDLSALMKRKESVVKQLTQGVASLLKKNKVACYTGRGTITGKGRVEVRHKKDQTELEAKHILIATGSKSAELKGVELDGDRIGTSTEALDYKEVPKRLVVIGAGYIGLELGSVWNRLGSQVTVLEYLDRVLPGMDSEIARDAHRLFGKQGLEFQLKSKVTGAKVKGKSCVVECEGQDPIRCDRVLLAVGRKPNTEGLGLDNVSLERDDRGFIPTDEHGRTSVDGIYAIGDVTTGPMLAHKAEDEGMAVAENIANGTGHVDFNTIPAVVYTHPEIGSVGRTEDQLKQDEVEYRKGSFLFRANGRAITLGETEGKVKVLADAKTDRILGVHILGPHASDLINEAAMAMAFGASSEDLARTCHAHPTVGEALREAALAVDRRAIHS